jgi:hypothetical protein
MEHIKRIGLRDGGPCADQNRRCHGNDADEELMLAGAGVLRRRALGSRATTDA